MKSIYIIAISFFCFIGTTQAQTPNWVWAKSSGGTGGNYNTAFSISTDAVGNSYITGKYSDTIIFGNDTLRSTSGVSNSFIAKYNSSGNFLWARSASSASQNESFSISIDANSNVYITGWFYGSKIVFANDTLINPSNIYGSTQAFITKYDSSGNEKWARTISGATIARSISIDAAGNSYITGTYDYGLFFVAKYDLLGNLIWNNIAGGVNTGVLNISEGDGISVDISGDVYATGGFRDTLILGTDTIVHMVPDGNLFIAKYNSAGSLLWAKTVDSAFGNSLVSDALGNVYVTGWFDGNATFGSYVLTTVATGQWPFIAKYDSTGNVLWAKTAIGGTTESVLGWNVSIDNSGNAYISGQYDTGTIIFGADTLSNHDGYSSFHSYLAKYDALGNLVWAAGPQEAAYIYAISTDSYGNVYITGNFDSAIVVFGSDTLKNSTSSGAYLPNVFLAKIENRPTEILTINQSIKITIYPNPSNGTFYFSGVQTGSGIEVYNMLGELVYNGQMNTDIYPVSLSGQAKGMYFYKVSNNVTTIQQGKMIRE